MRSRWAWLGAIVVSSSMALAACSSSSSPSTTTAPGTPAPASASSTAPQGANPASDFCLKLRSENAKFAQLSKTLGTAFASQDFAATKQTLTTYFDAVGQALADLESSMISAPADVQAALQTVNQYFTKLQSALAGATSLQELGTAFGSVGSTPQLKAAGATLKAYGTAQCGVLPSSSP